MLLPLKLLLVGQIASSAEEAHYLGGSQFSALGVLMLGIIAIAAAALAPASAEVPSAAATAAHPPSKPIVIEGNRRVCEETVSTGSILPKRVCKTVDQWKRDAAASQAFAAQRAYEQTIYQQMQFRIRDRKKEP